MPQQPRATSAGITRPCVPLPPNGDPGRLNVVTGVRGELFSWREPDMAGRVPATPSRGIVGASPATSLFCAFLFLLVFTFGTTPTHLLTKLHFFKSVPKMLFPGTDSPSGFASSWFACSLS